MKSHHVLHSAVRRIRSAVIMLPLLACSVAAQQAEITRTVEFENDRILITRIIIPRGFHGEMHSHSDASIEIFITDDHIKETRADGSVEDLRAPAGQVACFDPVTHRVQNLRKAPTEIIVVEFKGGAMKACPRVDPGAVRAGVEFENEWVRITRGKIGPRQTGQMHSHPEYVGIFLTDAKLRAYTSDGRVHELEGKRGFLRSTAPVTHKIENLSDVPFEAIDINIKPQASSPKPQ